MQVLICVRRMVSYEKPVINLVTILAELTHHRKVRER